MRDEHNLDSVRAARSELAYLRAVAEDRGQLSALIGWHLMGIGGVFGLDFLHVWAAHTGIVPWPREWLWLIWIPGVIAYVPVNLTIGRLGRGQMLGPTSRAFGASWAAIAVMSPPAVLALAIAQHRTGLPFYLIWPSLTFVLYGGAWASVAIARISWWQSAVALFCFLTALLAAAWIRDDDLWLLMAAAFFGLVLVPGLIIVRKATRP